MFTSVLWLAVIGALIILSFIVTAYELSLFSSDRIRLTMLRERGFKGASLALRLRRKPHETINAIIIVNILANTGIAVLLTHIFTSAYGESLGSLLALVIGTILIVLVGESIPKTLGVIYRESMVSILSPFMYIMIRFFTPVARILSLISSKIISPLERRVKKSREEISEEELRTMLRIAEKEGVISRYERFLMNNIMNFMDKKVEEIMIPVKNLVMISLEDDINKILDLLKAYGHSRYPVYRDNPNNVIGIIHVKDLLMKGFDKEIREIIRPITRIYHDTRLYDALRIMRRYRTHMLIVVDYNNNILGAVTLEDLIEEIFGEIYDEYDVEPSDRIKTQRTLKDHMISNISERHENLEK
ncbi:MAG: hemolysin family protein [Sulfolobales archaeon]